MIIGINGYISSGKDTVGKIIQYLTFPEDYYKKPSTFEEYYKMCTQDGAIPLGSNMIKLPNWQIKKFAGKLKTIAFILTGISIEKFEDQEFKKTSLGPEWATKYCPFCETRENTPKDDCPDCFEPLIVKPMTVRELLQKLGTEAIRNGLHHNAWVNALFADYKFEGCKNNGERCETPNGDCNSVHCYPNWIITDCRFPNEAKAIKEKGGVIVRVYRNIYPNDPITKDLHPSENSLDNWKFDYEIHNNSDINNLISETEKMLKYFNILS